MNVNEYEPQIKYLSETGHWKYDTDHTFYRYDKQFGGFGKFSNKQIKIMVFRKIDHQIYLDDMKN